MVLGFRRNLISGLVTLACVIVTFMLAPLITVITLPLFFYSFTWFCTIFTCYPIVKKYLILPALEAEQANREGSHPEDAAELPEGNETDSAEPAENDSE